MSAVIGIFERCNGSSPEASLLVASDQLECLGFGKPDLWIQSPIGFAHLTTVLGSNPPEKVLPDRNPTLKLAITSDVRLDNRKELSESLGLDRSELADSSDGRLLLLAWRKWGEDCPQHLIGDYAFAIWDPHQNSLFCARDHIGVKPLYYCLTRERFAFASDINGLLSIPGVSDQLDEEYLISALSDSNFSHNTRTYLRSIRKLEPGHSITVTPTKVRIAHYWFPENVPDVRFGTDKDFADAAREILTTAVNDRLRTTKKVGVHISGGLDSSGIAVLATRERRRRGLEPPKAYCWQPPPESGAVRSAEYSNVDAICTREGLTPQYFAMNASDFLDVLGQDPTKVPVESTLYVESVIQREASAQGVRLILSGFGGNEGLSFTGRGYYSDLLLRGRLRKLHSDFRPHGSALKLIVMEAILLLFRDRYQGIKTLENRSFLRDPELSSFLAPSLSRREGLKTPRCRQTSTRQTMLWLWNVGLLTKRTESWAASGAKFGISYAYPLLDRRLMEFVVGLPPNQFVRGEWKRWIMRTSMDTILPDSICWGKSGREPLRIEKFKSARHQALERMGERLSESSTIYSRAHYLDMPRLLESLTPKALAKGGQKGIIQALQFLDF